MNDRLWHAPPRYLFRRYNVLGIVKKLGVRSFVDVGCGAGDLACNLVSQLGVRGIGTDFNNEAIEMAKRLRLSYGLKDQPDFRKLDGAQIKKLPPADIVFCMEVLEHVKDDQRLLTDLAAISKKYVVISVPAHSRLFTASDELAGHYRRYDRDDLRKLIKQCDLEIKSLITYGYPFTNILRWLREAVSVRVKKNQKKSSMEKRSKKSGTDLLNINKYFVSWLPIVIWPLYQISRLFNRTDLSEGYLVVCEKINA